MTCFRAISILMGDLIIEENLQTFLNKHTELENVEAIALGGSTTASTSDNNSDIDIYIFSKTGIPLKFRENLIKPNSSKFEIGGEYFGSGDEFILDSINKQLDIMYWDMEWFEGVVNNTWVKYYPQNGYTTCFLYTLKNFNIIYDKNNWLHNLQNSINTPYPKALQENIIKRNLMLMKDKPFASYYEQIQKALQRNDVTSINHRISAFVASYFDVIFALNEQLHPGEKRLIQFAKANCNKLPKDFEENLLQLFKQPNSETLNLLDIIVRELKNII